MNLSSLQSFQFDAFIDTLRCSVDKKNLIPKESVQVSDVKQ